MAERTRSASREPESSAKIYDVHFKAREEFANRMMTGQLLVKSSERNWEISRQGKIKHYISPKLWPETAFHDWNVFIHDIVQQSGKHRHQGGIVLFVIEGRGYTVVDGVRQDWKKGDLILLPLKPGGVEHQHFNAEPGKPCKWLATIYMPVHEQVCPLVQQIETSPLYSGGNT
ncbi:MAG: cupin domain-containing protein [Chloroflexi bacterium]|nr:cupin domain-containing protein [Chloroflexota bacterium]